MKQGKKLQRWMKVLLTELKLNPDNWLYVKNEPGKLTIKHRKSNNIRTILIIDSNKYQVERSKR